MYKFALIRLKDLKGRISIYKLKINNQCELDIFLDSIKNDHTSEYAAIIAAIEALSDLHRFRKDRFKQLSGSKWNVPEYEIKTKNFRVYLFKDNNGHILVCGGAKVTQKKDLKRFRQIINEYLNQNQ